MGLNGNDCSVVQIGQARAIPGKIWLLTKDGTVIVTDSQKSGLKWKKRLGCWILFVFFVIFVLFYCFTGPRNLALYPPADQSQYRLPWPKGKTYFCVQGNRWPFTHRGWQEFAYDFDMPSGSDVCAARSGTVNKVIVENDGNGRYASNNLVNIRHNDETFAWYLHLKQGGSYVRVGDRVEQGQRIAASGNVGHSQEPHLHFHVTDREGKLLRVTFADVTGDAGIPRMFKWYTSGNSLPHK